MFKTTKKNPSGKVHIRKGDEVVVLSGKDAGKKGRVLHVDPDRGTAIVERVNFLKKHTRANPQKNVKGGILEREAPVRTSKLQVVCPSCGEPVRLGSAGSGARTCRKCNAELAAK